MKIKEVCKRTGLTERTIRFYVEENLIHPQMNLINLREYRDYSEEDIAELMTIADLRKLFFTLDEIKEMKQTPSAIADVVAAYKLKLKNDATAKASIVEILDTIDLSLLSDVDTLAARLSSVSVSLSLPERDIKPDFGKFDPESKEEREQQYQQYLKRQKGQFTRGKVIVFSLAAINMMSALISAVYDFHFLSLALNIIFSIALFFGVTWIRYFFALAATYGVFSSVVLILGHANELNLTTGLILLILLQMIYGVVSSVLLFRSQAISEFMYAQKNG
ncbi:MAG: MerR family transcriptional regulator [Gorillibacterium sp.]|nr:MerR family transcriptional regulator [Gorillibacterium sp.]